MVDIKKYGIAPVGALPNEHQIAHLKLSRKVFFHFGVNTFTSSEWGNGTEFVFIAKDGALKSPAYELLTKTFEKSPAFNLNYFPYKGSSSNSDYKNFDLGVGVMACKKGKACKYLTSKIHTNKDVVANSENVYYLANESAKFVNKLNKI